MCVTVVIVAVCSIATVRWWLLLFCLSNIEIVFKSLMMLYYYFFRVNNEKVPWLQVSEGPFCVLGLFGFLFWFVVSWVGFVVFVGVFQNVFSLSNWSVQGTFLYIWFTNSSIFPIVWLVLVWEVVWFVFNGVMILVGSVVFWSLVICVISWYAIHNSLISTVFMACLSSCGLYTSFV